MALAILEDLWNVRVRVVWEQGFGAVIDKEEKIKEWKYSKTKMIAKVRKPQPVPQANSSNRYIIKIIHVVKGNRKPY